MEEKILAVSETEDSSLAVLSVSDLTEDCMKESLKEAGFPLYYFHQLLNLHRIVQRMQQKIYLCSKTIQVAHRIICNIRFRSLEAILSFIYCQVSVLRFFAF